MSAVRALALGVCLALGALAACGIKGDPGPRAPGAISIGG